tara:strand:+ start:1157 stop:1339 length:183 start_codon:yes stop_codon:yes gene_type:complete
MHDNGNIRYANYQSEAQMTDYLTTQGHESVVNEIVEEEAELEEVNTKRLPMQRCMGKTLV